MTTKICKVCEVEKPLEDFSPVKTGRFGRAAICRECIAVKDRERYRTDPTIRDRKRKQMKQRRGDPQINAHINERRREKYPAKRQQGQKDYYARLREKHFFVWRARLWSARYSERVTALELFSIWHKQKGRCELSGRKLDNNAHLDHIVPISRGGAHGATNLRWIDPLVNVARSNMSDKQFIAMCRDVCRQANINITE